MFQEKKRWFFDNLEVNMKSLFSLVSCVFSFVTSTFSGRSSQMRVQFFGIVSVFFLSGFVAGQEISLRLPFPADESWVMTRGYETATHIDYGSAYKDDRYALDFVQNGCDSWQKPILAVASGIVIFAGEDGGWGLSEIIDHGDGYCSRYSHLDSISVSLGQIVLQGQIIGRCGNTGNVSGTFCDSHRGTHLHFAYYRNRNAEKPEPMSGYSNFTAGRSYKSDNNNLITGYYSDGWHEDGTSQAIKNVYDANGGEDVLGLAITPVYAKAGMLRQDFQNKFLEINPLTSPNVISQNYQGGFSPGLVNGTWDVNVSPAIIQAYNTHGKSINFGYPITTVTHQPNGRDWGNYFCQIFNGGVLGECAIVYNPNSSNKTAYPVQNRFWQWYENNGGPNYVMPNGFPLGSPTANEYYWLESNPNQTYVGPQARQDFENGYLYWDTANVSVRSNISFQIAGGTVPLTLTGWPVSNSQVVFNIQNGIDIGGNGWYAIFQDGVQMVATRLRDATINNLIPGPTHTYWVTVVDPIYGVLEQSETLTITLPPADPFYLRVRLDSENSVFLEIVNERFLAVPGYAIYRNGIEIARTAGTQFSDNVLDYNTTYIYKAVALTANHQPLGETENVSITTGSPPEVTPPPPPAPRIPQVPLMVIYGLGIIESGPYIINSEITVYFTVMVIGENPVTLERLEVTGFFTDQWGSVYQRNWRAITFEGGRTFQPGETYQYQMKNTGDPLPALPTTARLIAYAKVYTYAGLYQIPQTAEGSFSEISFPVLNAPPPVYRPNLVPSLELVSADPTDETAIELHVNIPNNGQVYCPSTTLNIQVDDGLVKTFTLPNINGNSNFDFVANIGRLSVGSHRVIAMADPDNLVEEGNESDNIVELTINVASVPRANLTLEITVPTDPIYSSTDTSISIAIINNGNAPSNICSLALTLSASDEEYLGVASLEPTNIIIPALGVSETIIITTIFRTAYPTDYTINTEIDSGKEIVESNETDNQDPVTFEVVSPLVVLPKPRFAFSQTRNYTTWDGRQAIGYEFDCLNWQEYPDLIFADDLGVTCGLNTSAARTWVDIYGLRPDNTRVYLGGFCGLSQAQDLDFVWFGISYGASLPPNVIVTLEDQKDGIVLESDPISIPPPPPSPGDAWDPIDDIVSGASATNNPTATEQTHGPHILSGSDRYDWFKVYLTAGRNYNFNSIGGTGDDYGELYSNASGTTRVAYNDDSGGNNQFSFTYAPASTGWYYLRVRAYSLGNNCSYSLKYRDAGAVTPAGVTDAWDPADNTGSGAVVLGNPTAVEQTHGSHTLSSSDYFDCFKVYLVAGRNYNFNTIGGSGDNYGELYINQSCTVRVSYNDDSGGNNQFSLTYKPTATGWHYLRVRAYSLGNNCNYSLKYRDIGL